ncbi:MAG: sigma-70 family RNA polymerase sigma factor [Pirellulales bacterium]
MNDDTQLIAATLQGDTGSFGVLVRKYQDRVFNAIFHVVGNRHEAEDLAQDTFVQAFLKLESFRGGSAFYTWVYRIAFNLTASRQRRKRPLLSVEDQREQTGADPADRGELPEEQLLRDERVEQVRAALQSLNDEFRTILVLREIEGCDYESIAEILNLAPGTVRSRLHRARAELRERLGEALQESPVERT